MSIEFQVEVAEKNSIPIVRVQGEIDVYTCPKLHDIFQGVLTEEKHNLLLDLENIQYIDSTGLGAIAHIAKLLIEREGRVHIVCNRPQIKKVFEISGLSKKNVTLFEQEEVALNEFK